VKSRRTINRILYALMTLLFSFSLAQAEPVTLQLKWKHQFQFAGFYMAKEKGFYRDAGFDVQIREVKPGTPAVAQLLDGSADYAVVDPGVLLARSKGAPIKVLSAIFQHSPLALIVREDSGIMSFAELRGKRIMMVPGLNADIDAALRSAGLTADDYMRQETSFDIRDLVNGKTDAFAGYETDQPYQLKELGIAYRIIHPREQDIDFYGDVLVTSERLLDAQPERVRAFTEASIRGWEYALEHIDETIDVIQEKYGSQKLSRKQLKFEALKTKAMIESDVVQVGYMRQKRWHDIADIYKKQGLLPADFLAAEAIYQPEPGFVDVLVEHRWLLGIALLITVILGLVMHATVLRRAVKARTASLQESEEQLRLALAAANQAWFDVNVQSGEVKMSPEYAPLLGYEPDEFKTSLQNWMEGVHPEDQDWVSAAFQACLVSAGPMTIEYRRQNKSGDWVWIHSIGEVIEWNSDNKPLRMIGIHRDVSQKKETELELVAERNQARRYLDVAEVMLCVLDGAGYVKLINKRGCRILGYNEDEIVGENWFDLTIPEELRGDVQAVFDKIMSGDVAPVEYYENEVLNKDNELRLLAFHNSYIENDEGNVSCVLFSAEDITDRKRTEKALIESEQNLKQAQMTAHIGSWTCDLEGRISWSEEQYLIYGVSPATFTPVMEAINNLVHPDDLANRQVWIEECIAGKKVEPFEFRIIRSDGDIRYLRSEGELIRDSNGNPIHMAAVTQDITEHKHLEEQFHQAQKMEAIGTLVGGIAHDFNNILAGITGNLYLAKQRVQDQPVVLHNLDSVELLSFRAADLIRQLLTFARKDLVDIKPLPFTPFIKETLKFLRTSLPENIKMDQQISSDVLMINGDATQLHQVLMNLVNNARDAVEGVHDPSITVTLQRFEPDELFLEKHGYFVRCAYAHITVKDNGSGIADEQLEHLFEPFFTTKPQGKGTGLGLAMVFGAIKTHKGFVEVESCVGKGTTFHVYLPLTGLLPEQDLLREEFAVCDGSGETILLVDDEINIIETGREVLESLGYRVLTAFNGEQACAMFEQHRDAIDLCIFDLVMPEMGGYEAAEKIRQMEPQAKIIFATGYDKSSQVEMENEIVIAKPFAVVKLSQLIREQLES